MSALVTVLPEGCGTSVTKAGIGVGVSDARLQLSDSEY